MTGFLTGPDGKRVPVHDGMIIGRVHGCDLVVDDTKVSRKHARLIVAGGVAEIEDLGSSNGTLLNGKLVARRVLRDGDEVVFGNVTFRYTEGDPAPAPASASALPAASPPAPAADDDVDLFGGPAPAATPPAPLSPPPAPLRPAPSAPPPARPQPREVVEFADEVVEVRQAPKPAVAATGSSAGPQVQRQQHVLQFSRFKDQRGGPLGDDIAQLSSNRRIVVYLLLTAGFAGVVYAIVQWMG